LDFSGGINGVNMEETFWTKEKIIAYLMWVGQIINAIVALAKSLPDTSTIAEQAMSGQTKTAVTNLVVAVGLGLLQGFLPRLQKKKK
jgi:hypothetical protein